MVSLCGLALSSLFVLNNKSVVHADATTDTNQNSAISWNSDSDTAQGVQNTQNTQKADDDQQNIQSVQPSRAETSTVQSISAAPHTINQNAAVQSPCVANVQDVQASNPIVINNPAGDKVNVHYVNRNGGEINDANVKDTTVDASKAGQGSYQVPSGYDVNNPSGKYDVVNNGPIKGTNLKGSVEHVGEERKYALGDLPMDSLNPDINKWISKQPEADGYNWYVLYEAEGDSAAADYDGGDPDGMPAQIVHKGDDAASLAYYNGEEAAVDTHLPSSTITDRYLSLWDDNSGAVNEGLTSLEDSLYPVTKSHLRGDAPEDFKTKLVNALNAYSKTNGDKMYHQMMFSVDDKRPYSEQKPGEVLLNAPLKLLEKVPAYDVQHLPVAFVDNNNNIIGMINNYSGKVGTTQNVNLTLPTGYKLAAGESLPTSVTFVKSTDPLLIKVISNGQVNTIDNFINNKVHLKFVDQETGNTVGTSDIDLGSVNNGVNIYQTPNGYATNARFNIIKTNKPGLYVINDATGEEKDLSDEGASLLTHSWMDMSVEKGTREFDGLKLTDSAPGFNGQLSLCYSDQYGNLSVINSGYSSAHADVYDYLSRIGIKDGSPITSNSWTIHGTHTLAYKLTTNLDIDSGNIIVPVHKSNSLMFFDNSGNAVSAKDNTVDVALTKKSDVDPSKVDPNSPGYKITHSSATRTIHVAFPDNQIPVSYKNIVDSNGDLIQTVHFTRDATVDTLLDPSDKNYVISEGAWKSDNKDPNFIGFEARTLPRIPGYTLKITPAAVHA